jgi:hypothetical protein
MMDMRLRDQAAVLIMPMIEVMVDESIGKIRNKLILMLSNKISTNPFSYCVCMLVPQPTFYLPVR